ncbi:MAG: serine hydrolase domain-containing protein [Oscillospiraceae bacterium]
MNMKKISEVMENAVKSGEEVGAAAVIVKDGEPVGEYACGYADVNNKKPMKTDTICRMFSCSKITTAIAAMICLERGFIAMEDELCRFIPEFEHSEYCSDGKIIPCSRRIKIADLLNMTSGIAYPCDEKGAEAINTVWYELDKSYRDGNMLSTMEFAKRAAACPLLFDVGEKWMYGSSADIMGAVVEAASGMEYRDFLKKYIFDPLGMNDTDFFVPKDKRDRLAKLYECAGKEPKEFTGTNLAIFDFEEKPNFQSGGAGLFSTAEDYAKLGAALSTDGRGIISRKTVDFLSVNSLSDRQRESFVWDSCKGCGYANFMRIVENRNNSGMIVSDGSFCWDGWTGTYLMMDPKEKLSISLTLQRAGAGTTRLAKALINAAESDF